MKHFITYLTAGSLAIVFASPGAFAQDPYDQDGNTSTTRGRSTSDTTTATALGGTVVRGSSLIGCEVQDSTGKEIGTVHDLVVGSDGSIEAVLLECDKFDDGFVAMPLSALTARYQTAEPDSEGTLPRDRELEHLVLNAANSTLFESSPRTRLDRPVDREFIQRLDNHFGLTTDTGIDRSQHPLDGERDLDVSGTTRDSEIGRVAYHRDLQLASEVLKKDVVNQSAEGLGEIEDLAVAVDRGEVLYAVMGSGGLLGIGEKRFAVPWRSLDANPNDENKIILDVTKDRLAQAEGFKHWPASGDTVMFRELPRTSMRDADRIHDGTRVGIDRDRRDNDTPGTQRRNN